MQRSLERDRHSPVEQRIRGGRPEYSRLVASSAGLWSPLVLAQGALEPGSPGAQSAIEPRNAINIPGTGRVVAVATNGKTVYAQTTRTAEPARSDPQIRAQQSWSAHGIAIYDVAQGAFVREIPLEDMYAFRGCLVRQ